MEICTKGKSCTMPEEDHIRRDEAVRSLQQYVSETLEYIDTVRNFSAGQASDWRLERNAELSTLKEIPKLKKKEEQQEKLATVLKNTLEGVEKLTRFLDAVEKLAVTSLQVFTGGEEVVKLSVGISLESVEDIISAARLVCPLLLCFKRDAEVFFTPSLHNVAVFEAELDRYIDTTEKICTMMEKSSAIGFEDRRGEPPQVQLAENLTSDVVQNISSHVDQLSEIRKDQDFRLVFLFQEESVWGFIDQFSESLPRMLQFLDDMEGCAVQLDRMNTGSKISRVAWSSVGIVGGVLSIVGVALAPFTAGVSLGLTIGGGVLGATSGLNSLVTSVTGLAVNRAQKKRAGKGLQSFMEDVGRIQTCLDEVINQRERKFGTSYWVKVKAAATFVGLAYTISEIAREIAEQAAKIAPEIAEQAAKIAPEIAEQAAKIAPEIAEQAAKIAPEIAEQAAKIAPEIAEQAAKIAPEIAEQAAKIAPEIAEQAAKIAPEIAEQAAKIAPEIAEQAAKIAPEIAEQGAKIGPEVAEKATMGARAATKMAFAIGLNVFFIGLDIHLIYKDGSSLARGEQSEASQFIRARAALLRSEVNRWSRIHDSVVTGMKQFESRENVLQRSFRDKL